jgi:hypothetical protein
MTKLENAMAREMMTLRLERSIRSRLEIVAKRRRLSASAAARLALEEWLRTEERASDTRPYDQIADLIGSSRRVDSTRGRGVR